MATGESWRLWGRSDALRSVEVETPRLASWMSKTHRDQIRLTAYLEDLVSRLSPLPLDGAPLYLHMHIAVRDEQRLLTHHDLENYLPPLFGRRWLPCRSFALVTAEKRMGGVSRIDVGYAGGPTSENLASWGTFETTLSGGLVSRRKIELRSQLGRVARELPPGPVEVQLAWRCSSRRNWTTLWIPTGDTMGPILGVTRNAGFNPRDDRIVSLSFHREIDETLGNRIVLGMWWRSEDSVRALPLIDLGRNDEE